MSSTATPTTVGAFTFDPTTSVITGPAAYMASPEYAECMASIKDGTNHVMRSAMAPGGSPSFEVALLVTIQTNYAGWEGLRRFKATCGL